MDSIVRVGADYGVSRNRDLNESEWFLAKAITNGLHYYRDAQAPASTTDGDRQDQMRQEIHHENKLHSLRQRPHGQENYHKDQQVQELKREERSITVWTLNYNHRRQLKVRD